MFLYKRTLASVLKTNDVLMCRAWTCGENIINYRTHCLRKLQIKASYFQTNWNTLTVYYIITDSSSMRYIRFSALIYFAKCYKFIACLGRHDCKQNIELVCVLIMYIVGVLCSKQPHVDYWKSIIFFSFVIRTDKLCPSLPGLVNRLSVGDHLLKLLNYSSTASRFLWNSSEKSFGWDHFYATFREIF